MQPMDQKTIDDLLKNSRATKEEIAEYDSLLAKRFSDPNYKNEAEEKRLKELYNQFHSARYMITYDAPKADKYVAPTDLMDKLQQLGVQVKEPTLGYHFIPLIVAVIPDDKVEKVKALEGIVGVFPDIKFDLA